MKPSMHIWMTAALLVTALLLAITPARAATPGEIWDFRDLFNALESSGSIKKVLNRKTWPKDPFLRSYLDYEILVHPRTRSTIPKLKKFLKKWPNHGQSERIKNLISRRMVHSGSDQEALAWFDQRPPRSRSGGLRHLRLLLKAKRTKEAEPLWKRLYLNGTYLPTRVKRQAKKLGFEKKLTPKDVEDRARAFLKRGRYRRFREQIRSLPRQRRAYFHALEAARRSWKKFDKMVKKLPKADRESPELWAMRIERLRKSGYRERARRLLDGPEGKYLDPENRALIRFRLGRTYLFSKDSPVTARPFFEANVKEGGGRLEDSAWLAGWTAYLAGDKAESLEFFQRLAEEAPNARRRSQGAFWAARVLQELGRKGRISWLKRAAKSPATFYGQLAREALGEESDAVDWADFQSHCPDPKSLSAAEKSHYDLTMERAQILKAVGRGHYVGGEIRQLGNLLGLDEEAVMCLALNNDAPNLAVRIARRAYKNGEVRLSGLFPAPDWRPKGGWELEKSLVWGVVRQESLFFHRVESSARARGLMQLIPPTARSVARQVKEAQPSRYLLDLPEYNLKLGQAYLKGLLKQFDGDVVLALISYNAGPHRAVRWGKKRRRSMDGLMFIESIPFTETRHYVKRVLKGVSIYRSQLTARGKEGPKMVLTPVQQKAQGPG